MNRTALMIVLMQALLSGCAVIMSTWVEMPWPGVVALGLLGASLMVADAVSVTRRERVGKWVLTFTWGCTLAAPGSLLLASGRVYTLDCYYAELASLITAAVLLTNTRIADVPLKTQWRLLGVTWAFFDSFIWLAASYSQNRLGSFFVGLLIGLTALILCKSWFRLPPLAIQTVNTLLLLLVGLPIVDLLLCPIYHSETLPDPARQYYSYETWKRDPAAFDRWHNAFQNQWYQAGWGKDGIAVTDSDSVLQWRVRPNGHGLMFRSSISINSKGFRGKEIPSEKGNAYRIVALGESSTFGITLNAEDRPWPELLEQIINERMKPHRPVEVINAGVPGYSLKQNLYRLPKDILPLKPDMIISYHGYNGFFLIEKAMPQSYAKNPPAYKKRPLKLLADCEYRLKLISFKRHQIARLVLHPPTFSNPMETECAQAYRQLFQMTQTNGIRLVLANFSMAVNSQSDPDVIDFYRAIFPAVHWQIRANGVHSTIVEQLVKQCPEVCFVDTHPNLDGKHEKFIDLIHFSQDGDRQLAETFFAGIRKVLEEDLSRSYPYSTKR
jgi:lysophospholipase L1-like esterase